MSNTSVSRRHFLVGLGLAGGAGIVAGGGGLAAVQAASDSSSSASTPGAIPFRDTHQAGITTAQQENLHIVALDVLSKDKAELKDMLTQWTAMAERMTQGLPAAEEDSSSEYAVPKDSGEAQDLDAQNLTITIGYGPSLFDRRFGLQERKPAQLKPLPTFPGDQLKEELCDGDIVIQACADDPQVAVHAVRNLIRAGSGTVEVRWSQLGYGRASSTNQEQSTPRNLFGFKDGTRNIHSLETADLDAHVWSSEEGWMKGGSYLCARRIPMLLEIWDRQILGEQQATFARYRHSGAPSGSRTIQRRNSIPSPSILYWGRSRRSPPTLTSSSRTRTTTTASGCCAAPITSSRDPITSGTSRRGCSSSPLSQNRKRASSQFR